MLTIVDVKLYFSLIIFAAISSSAIMGPEAKKIKSFPFYICVFFIYFK